MGLSLKNQLAGLCPYIHERLTARGYVISAVSAGSAVLGDAYSVTNRLQSCICYNHGATLTKVELCRWTEIWSCKVLRHVTSEVLKATSSGSLEPWGLDIAEAMPLARVVMEITRFKVDRRHQFAWGLCAGTIRLFLQLSQAP